MSANDEARAVETTKAPKRVRRKVSITDGPFAETYEGIGGAA